MAASLDLRGTGLWRHLDVRDVRREVGRDVSRVLPGVVFEKFVLSPHRRFAKLASMGNSKPARPALAFVVLLVANSLVTAHAVSADRSPIMIDTDIGTGIDDAFALGLAFGGEELDVRGVTTSGDPAQKKAMMVCRFLTMTGRRHTPVAVGADPQPARPITDQEKYHYHPDPLFDRTTKPEDQPAADFLHS